MLFLNICCNSLTCRSGIEVKHFTFSFVAQKLLPWPVYCQQNEDNPYDCFRLELIYEENGAYGELKSENERYRNYWFCHGHRANPYK